MQEWRHEKCNNCKAFYSRTPIKSHHFNIPVTEMKKPKTFHGRWVFLNLISVFVSCNKT